MRPAHSQENTPPALPMIVIDARNLPRRDAHEGLPPGEERIVVVYASPTVSCAFKHFRGSAGMLAKALARAGKRYCACVNRGHIHRQKNI